MTDAPTTTPPGGEESLDAPAGGPRFAVVMAGALAALVAGLVLVLAVSDTGDEAAGKSNLLGRLAPATAGTTLDGDEIDIDDHRGQWVFVNFFASWCVPCLEEHPELRAFDEAHREIGDAVLVGVTYDNVEDDARDFFAEHGGDWPVINDPDNSIGVSYGISKVPETWIIAPDGTVVARFARDVDRDDLEDALAELKRASGDEG